ncbi:MAG: ABC transporter permease [Acutalibacteraceae bacterium]|nr:ABC transporter permease [Acutalibacteraceae bacterium]
MIALIKTSLKLLLRNKGFLFFLIVTPILSTVILGIKMDHTVYTDNSNKGLVLDLKSHTEKAVYVGDTSACIIKVYDASNSELSEYVLGQMAETGMFSVCRADVSGLTEEEIAEATQNDAFNDRAGMLLYLKEEFDEAVLAGNLEQGLKLYEVSEDERQEIFVIELTDLIGRIKQVQNITGDDVALMLETLTQIEDKLPEKETVNFAGKEAMELTEKQINQKTQIGYAFAIITLGFLFCGVCVAHSVIQEQNNKVFTRVLLTKLSSRDYFISKFVVAFVISLIQTFILAICLIFIPGLDVGMSIISFLLIIFLLGLIFSTLSFLLGVLLGDVMSSNYAAFAIWSISALLAGLYFPLDDTTKALKTLSYLMPQRWFMDASELLLIGDKSAYSMVLCVTVAYLIAIISVGSVGLKIKRHE